MLKEIIQTHVCPFLLSHRSFGIKSPLFPECNPELVENITLYCPPLTKGALCRAALTVALTMLFNIIGISALATVAAMIGQYIYQVAAGRISYFYQKEVLSASDARLTLSSEILHGIKTLKFLAWERGFAEALQAKRNAELHALRKQTVIRALISGVTCELWARSESIAIWTDSFCSCF